MSHCGVRIYLGKRLTAAELYHRMSRAGMSYERRMVLQREADARREAMMKNLAEDSRVQQVNKWQSKAQMQRWRNSLTSAERDALRDRERREREIAARAKRRQEEQEQLLAQELRKRKEKERAEAAKIELIIQNDPKLKEIESKLKLAYVNKARTLQLKQKAALEWERKREHALEKQNERETAAKEADEAEKKERTLKMKAMEREAILKQI